MSPLDIGFIAILGFFMIKGLLRGIVLESFTLIGIIAGYVIALREMGKTSDYLQSWFTMDDTIAAIAGFLLVFSGVFLIFKIAAHLIIKLIRNTPANAVDKGGGLLFGALKGILICGCVAVLIDLIPANVEPVIKIKGKSFLFSPARSIAKGVFNGIRVILPNTREFTEEWKEGLNKKSREMQEHLLEEQMKTMEKHLEDKLK